MEKTTPRRGRRSRTAAPAVPPKDAPPPGRPTDATATPDQAKAPRPRPRAAPQAEGFMAGLRVLVVEDNPVSQLFVTHVLEMAGCRVMAVATGHDALWQLGVADYDIVLMDIVLPGMDGLETTAMIRAGKAGEGVRDIPILAMTAHNTVGDRERFMARGVDGYVAKPVELDRLEEAMRRILEPDQGDKTN